MDNTKITQLANFGQSAWLDYISRSLIETKKLEELIGLGLRGLTSNPAIFEKAINSGSDYDQAIYNLCRSGKSAFEIYDCLTIQDIRDAADIFMPVFKDTGGLDGYVSLEINPKLAYDKGQTIEEGKRLQREVARPNLMLKVPATEEGFSAIEELTACGMNVNATLIFSLKQYVNTANAYIRGINRYLKSNSDANKIRSVASCFVSRIDTVIDDRLDELARDKPAGSDKDNLLKLKGKAAVSNCAFIYKNYSEIFSSAQFKNISLKGANPQRVLWASTSTKNPAYRDIKYVTELIAKNTVNTLPQNTLEAFLGHGSVKEALTSDVFCADNIISALEKAGIGINDVCADLLRGGLAAFEKSFDALLSAIEAKKERLCVIAN